MSLFNKDFPFLFSLNCLIFSVAYKWQSYLISLACYSRDSMFPLLEENTAGSTEIGC